MILQKVKFMNNNVHMSVIRYIVRKQFTNTIYLCYTVTRTIAGTQHGEQIFFFGKNKVRLSKFEFLNFCFLAKKEVRMTLNSLKVKNAAKTNLFYFCFSVFKIL
jgi:hypothetical protein